MESTPATIRMIISGSENFSKKRFHSGTFSGGVSTLTPFCNLLCKTCSLLSPV